MNDMIESSNRRILVIDDNEAIHADFRKILVNESKRDAFNKSSAAFFGEDAPEASDLAFDMDSAFQGEEGLQKVCQSLEQDLPYAMAFVDVRMPPGWDGITTIGKLWEVDPNLMVVICTAYSDYDWSQMEKQLGNLDRWVILKKPFDNIEVRQLACSLTTKWDLARQGELTVTQLEQLVEQRTRKLEQAQQHLLESQKLESIGTLTAGVAHEFNNLLQIMTGYTQAGMESLTVGDQVHQDLQHVLTAASKAAKLTSGLLGFGRRQMMSPVDFDPNEAISDVVKALRPTFPDGITIEIDLADNVGFVHADPPIFQQILMSLCLNSCDAMTSGGCLTVSTEKIILGDESLDRNTLRPGSYLRLKVADTGCGMSQEVQQRVFEPFFTTKEVGQGTGLGLASVYGNVQQLEGSIEFNSQLTKGTTFSICLPAVDPLPVEVTPQISPQRLEDATGEKPHGTILVVDDEKQLRDCIIRILKHAGYETLSASDGVEAVEVFKSNAANISLVLLDVVMPRMCGHEAYQQMQQIRPDIPVIVCSGYDPQSPHIDFVARTGLQLIRKPFNHSELLQAVQERLVNYQEALGAF